MAICIVLAFLWWFSLSRSGPSSFFFALQMHTTQKIGYNMRSSNDTLPWQQIYSCDVVRMHLFFFFFIRHCSSFGISPKRSQNGRTEKKTCEQNNPVNSFCVAGLFWIVCCLFFILTLKFVKWFALGDALWLQWM